MATIRQAKVGEAIKRDLAEILQKEMRDPRLAMVTITGVDVARDFTVAKVFISTVGDDAEKAAAIKGLQGAAGFLRGQLGRMLNLRTIPNLVFRYDVGIERGIHMFELLRQEGAELAEMERNRPAEETDDAVDGAEDPESEK